MSPWARMRQWWSGKGASDSLSLLALIGAGAQTKSGQSVSETSALQVSTVFSCLRVLGEGCAQVPLKLYREANGTREVQTQHPAHRLMHRRPNPWMTAFALRETLVWHAALTGDAFALIMRGSAGEPMELVLLQPDRVAVKQAADLSLSYEVTGASGSKRTVPAANMLHLRGPSWVGHEGLSVVQKAREAIGLAMSSEESQARMHARGMQPSGLYSVDGTLPPTAYKALREWVDKELGGSENAGRTLILDRAAKFTPLQMSSVDAQHLETRNHQIGEVCAFFRVMPIMVGFSDKTATYASAEQMFLAHVVHTLAPWYERIEQTLDAVLLTDKERADGFYFKHIAAGLMRGALKDQAQFLHTMVQDGVMTRNEARGMLDLNPIAGLDEPLTPVNLTTDPAGAGDTSGEPNDGTPDDPAR